MTESNKKRFQPKYPVMVWDEDCQFCKLCTDRFKALALDNIEFIPYQDLSAKYPKAPDLDYKKSIVFFTHNNTYTGAAAVFSYYSKIGKKLPMWLYRRFKLFERISEISYRFIANHRRMFRLICQTFWGSNLLPDSYKTSGWIYGRLLGLVGIIAFLSLWVQSDMLISSSGIVPFQSDLGQVEGFITTTGSDISKWFARPTILWFSKTDLWLNIVLCLGTFSSTLLLLGIVPHISIAISWTCYLSVASVSEPFLNFQWDALLLETYLLSIFFVPWKVIDDRKNIQNPATLGKWLLWLLIIKLMFESGLVKFTFFGADGSNTWRDLTALNYHYWTQPIPSWISWYVDKLPEVIDKISLGFTYFCELIIPFMIFFPRRIRRTASFSLIVFQALIIITGNYGFFNLLTIVVCLTLIDDQFFGDYFSKWLIKRPEVNVEINLTEKVKRFLAFIILICFIFTMIFFINRDLKGSKPTQNYNDIPSIGRTLIQAAQVTRSMNAYGLFRVMTETRPEIYIEVLSADSVWSPVVFNYKPVKPDRRPKFFFPHMPRIDWQLWFEALYFERLTSNPFALSAYQRFLEVMVTEDLKMGDLSINNFINKEDQKILGSLGYAERQNYINNLQVNINNHLKNSYWFVRFLSKLVRQDPILRDFHQANTRSSNKKLRISLYYYSFSDNSDDDNTWWKIDNNNGHSIAFDLEQ